jgi:hypothetical protein
MYIRQSLDHYLILILMFLTGCSSETPSGSFNDIVIVELQEFETFIAVEDQVLAAPTIIRYDGESSLFVYENSSGSPIQATESLFVITIRE